jgi:hypothetical protein
MSAIDRSLKRITSRSDENTRRQKRFFESATVISGIITSGLEQACRVKGIVLAMEVGS